MKSFSHVLLALVCIVLGFNTAQATPGPKKSARLYISRYENVLGTSLELKIAASSEKEAAVAEQSVLQEIKRLSGILSAYNPASEFSRWFTTRNESVHVSPELFEVLDLFDQWRMRSHGALDAAAEAVGKLWKHASLQQRIPTQEELDSVVAQVKLQHWSLNSANQTATHLSNVPLMLNSFVKSYIIKKAAAAAMASPNISTVVVNIGGDMVIAGSSQEKVQIRDPKADAENDEAVDMLMIGNRAVATSGNYRRGELINGHWYSHIVDPRTGIPSDNILSATVVAPNAVDAGALATAFNVMPPDESIELANGFPGAEYFIITKSGERIESKGWKALEVPASKRPAGNAGLKKNETSWANVFELIINLEIKLQGEQFTKRPYVAVWVEDQNHATVRTIALWHERDRYLPELKSWYLKYRGMYNADKTFLGSVSSATRSPGKYTIKWDGKDDKGNLTAPGLYTIKIEVSREHGTYQLMRQELNCNDQPQLINLPGNTEIATASLDYRKKSGNN